MKKFQYFSNKNKYGAKKSKCRLGHSHASKLEAGYCNQLQMLKKAGEIQGFEVQKRFELRLDDVLICCHYPDFLVTRKSGEQEIHETKGAETDIWRLKHKLFKFCYPDIPYFVIK